MFPDGSKKYKTASRHQAERKLPPYSELAVVSEDNTTAYDKDSVAYSTWALIRKRKKNDINTFICGLDTKRSKHTYQCLQAAAHSSTHPLVIYAHVPNSTSGAQLCRL
jgi:hypothetical protein